MRSAAKLGALGVLLSCGLAHGQDSVATVPGQNDALSAYEIATLRTRYVVDGAALTSSWGNEFRISPIAKATRDLDPMFRTQILGSAAVSPKFAASPAAPAPSYAFWTSAGAGVSPTGNTAAGTLSPGSFADQFSVAFVDHALDPTNLVVARVGRDPAAGNRFYVERTHAASSRATAGGLDTSTLALGAVTAGGRAFVRADAFTALSTTADRISGDNVVSVNAGSLSVASPNTLINSGGANTAADAVNTTYILRNDSAPYSAPNAIDMGGASDRALIFDLRAFYRSGSSTANLSSNTSSHRPAGIAGHRGNPGFAPITPLGGTLGTVAALAKPTAGGATALVDTLAAFGVNSSGLTAPVAAGTPRSFTLPSPISVPGFSANASGNARFDQYKSQHVYRGGSGVVGIGANEDGQLVLAAAATDPTQGDFIAVVSATDSVSSVWSIAAFPGQQVLDGPGGSSVGSLSAVDLRLSAPAVDLLGNVYFAATWTPDLLPERVGVFKAVNVDGVYRIEKLLAEGDQFTGPNSATDYTVSTIALRDSDSLASGAFHSSSLLQAQTPGMSAGDPASPFAAGGLVVNATITYDRSGTPESYEAVLLITPDITPEPMACPGDYNDDGVVDLGDLVGFNTDWQPNIGQTVTPGSLGDYNQDGTVDLADLVGFNTDWQPNIGLVCP